MMSRVQRRGRLHAWILALVAATGTGSVLQAVPTSAQGVERRWEFEEPAYEDRSLVGKAGVNLRDGTVGLFDSLAQGLLGVFTIFNPRSGGVALQKVATFGGDVVGLVDNNPITQPVFKGIVSRQLLRLGAGAMGAADGIAWVHDTEFPDAPRLTPNDYVGDTAFHAEAYVTPSVVASLGGLIVGDVVVRPAGHLLMIFGFRETGERLNEQGLYIVEESLSIPFL